VLLQDWHLVEKPQRVDRERISERVVHARGTGAFGDFVPSADLSDLTRAQVFSPGSKTASILALLNGDGLPRISSMSSR
jgi:catalase